MDLIAKFGTNYIGRPNGCTLFFYEYSIDIRIKPIYICLKCRKSDIFIFVSFCAVAIGPKNIKTFLLVLTMIVTNCHPILFLLNNFKSTATMVTPKF